MSTPARRFQQKYAWDLAQMGNALYILQRVGKEYGLHFGSAMFNSYHEDCKVSLKAAYERMKPRSTYVRPSRSRKAKK